MPTTPYRAEQLTRQHRRGEFSCGVDDLDRYLREQATQDARRDLAAPYVLVDTATGAIAGYYTLSAFSVDLTGLPESERKRAGTYRMIPAIIIGRLARDLRYRKQGVGELLLLDAFRRSWILSRRVGAWAVVVDAKEGARWFYESFGFIQMIDDPNRLFIPMKMIEQLLRRQLGDKGLAALAEDGL